MRSAATRPVKRIQFYNRHILTTPLSLYVRAHVQERWINRVEEENTHDLQTRLYANPNGEQSDYPKPTDGANP